MVIWILFDTILDGEEPTEGTTQGIIQQKAGLASSYRVIYIYDLYRNFLYLLTILSFF